MQPSVPPETASPDTAPALSRGRLLAFRAVALLLPVVGLLLIEGALRLAGVGAERRRPFVEVPGHASHVALSPRFGAQFFGGFQPGVAFDPVAAEPAPGTLRVFALGGSTTAGFPYHFYYGFPARLEDRLAAMLPGRPVEVANLGMTATNSYTLWALAPAVAARQPDAVVVYAGQNEFYGAYGTGGTEGRGGTSSVATKRLLIRTSQTALGTGLTGLIRGEPEPQSRTMMARVVQNAAIDEQSDAFRAGVRQYEANLRDAIETFGAAGVPVFLATLTSNLGDQPPLGDDEAAAAAFERGRTLYARGDTVAARAAFVEAKEADGLRFRAPEAMNEVVRRLAAEYPHVTLVDVAGRFRAASPGGIEGASLFTDHLHPTAEGYALMADAFADALRQRLPALVDAADPGPAPSAIDPIEAGVSRLQLAILTGGYPFRKDRTPAEAEAAARALAERMTAAGGAEALAARVSVENLPIMEALDAEVRQAQAAGDTLAALRSYHALLHWQPFNAGLMERAVGYAIQSPAYDDETAALARYATIHAPSGFALNALAAVSLRQGDLDRAEAALAAVERLDPRSPEMLFNRARLLVMRGDTAAARGYFERYRQVAQP